MNRLLTWSLALRYLRGKRSANAVPVLSRISMVAIAVGTGALIVLFSVFNGFEDLVKENYKAFYSEVKITVARGKFFTVSPAQLQAIQRIKGVRNITTVLEDNVLANSETQQQVVTLKGIDDNYLKVNDITPFIKGADSVTTLPVATAIVGLHLANVIGADINNKFSKIMLYYPNAKIANPGLNPAEAFQSLALQPTGDFQVQEEFDGKYILAPLSLVQDLFGEQGYFSSVELSTLPNTDANNVKMQLQQLLGSNYKIETRFEQNKTLYMVMNTEKWAVYAILLLVLLIASFNMVGALSLLVLEKEKDIAILKAMGAQSSAIRAIFMLEGILWSLTGGILGLAAGAALCLGQQHFQWIKLQGSFIISAYPVSMQWNDFALVIATIIVIGVLASWYPAIRATKAEIPLLKSS